MKWTPATCSPASDSDLGPWDQPPLEEGHRSGRGRADHDVAVDQTVGRASAHPAGQAHHDPFGIDRRGAEGWFLSGLAEKAAGNRQRAAAALSRALHYDAGRYDAAVELAAVHAADVRNSDAKTLLDRYEPDLANSPYYLHMAATTWTQMGMHARAWPLYQSANALQPGVEKFQASLAACAVLMGQIDEARSLYLDLL